MLTDDLAADPKNLHTARVGIFPLDPLHVSDELLELPVFFFGLQDVVDGPGTDHHRAPFHSHHRVKSVVGRTSHLQSGDRLFGVSPHRTREEHLEEKNWKKYREKIKNNYNEEGTHVGHLDVRGGAGSKVTCERSHDLGVLVTVGVIFYNLNPTSGDWPPLLGGGGV